MLVFVRMLRRLGPDRLAPAVVTAEEANAVTIGCVNRRVGVGISCVPGCYLPVKQGVDGLFVGAPIVVCESARVVAGHCHLLSSSIVTRANGALLPIPHCFLIFLNFGVASASIDPRW